MQMECVGGAAYVNVKQEATRRLRPASAVRYSGWKQADASGALCWHARAGHSAESFVSRKPCRESRSDSRRTEPSEPSCRNRARKYWAAASAWMKLGVGWTMRRLPRSGRRGLSNDVFPASAAGQYPLRVY